MRITGLKVRGSTVIDVGIFTRKEESGKNAVKRESWNENGNRIINGIFGPLLELKREFK